MSTLSTGEVSRILGVPEARVLELVRAGLCQPVRRGRGYGFSFQDLVVLRTAHGLVKSRVPAARVKRALRSLARDLPEGRSVAGLRIYADGGRVTVRDGKLAWEPETGQRVLDFGLDELVQEVASLKRSDSVGSEEAERVAAEDASIDRSRRVHAREEFEQGLALEEVDVEAAGEAYRRAIELDPDLADAYVNLGRLVYEAGKAREAVVILRRAVELAPDDAIAHYDLALALEDASDAAGAQRSYERAIELAPTFADAHWNLASLHEAQGRRAAALRHYAEYRRLHRKR